MRSLPKVLLYSFAGLVGFAVFAFVLTVTIKFLPYGVPVSRIDEYNEKVREIKSYAEAAKNADKTASPIAVAESTSFKFGMIDPHSTLSHDFVIRNDGELPLELKVLETSCKCTVGELKNGIVLPGDSTVVTMTWNTGYQAEQYNQEAIVATNDPLQKTIKLSVSGQVKAKLVAPQEIAFAVTDPGEIAEAEFVVYSQLWEDFSVTAIESDLKEFDWTVAPIELDHVALLDKEPRSAWKVKINSLGNKRGRFSGKLSMSIEPLDGGEGVTREVLAQGKVRAPISFQHKDIHPQDGLHLGTLVSDQDHEFHMVVRARGDKGRHIQVLGVKPEIIRAELESTSVEGSYRLSLRIPKGTPLTVFNRDSQHGYVHIGDPDDESFSNWFPLRGAVIDSED